MTRTTIARVAGLAFILYIATGMAQMALSRRWAGGPGMEAKLAAIARNATLVRVDVFLTFTTFVYAVVLAVTLWALTREDDPVMAALGASFRLTEGILGAVECVRSLALIGLATAATTDTAALAAGSALLKQGGATMPIGSLAFACGSTAFCWVFLKARSIPVWLAGLGLAASVLLVVSLPVQMILEWPKGAAVWAIWMPMLVFELTFAGWLLATGAPIKARR